MKTQFFGLLSIEMIVVIIYLKQRNGNQTKSN